MENNDKNKNMKSYVKYSGVAFQMFIVIALFTWGGKKLDQYLEYQKPTFLVALSLLGVIAAIYIVIKDLIKKQ